MNPFESHTVLSILFSENVRRKALHRVPVQRIDKFRSLNGEKWREAASKGLVKVMWEEGVVLCNSCYMQFVENPLRRGLKRVKVIEVEDGSTPAIKLELADAIKAMAKILYEREYVEKRVQSISLMK